MSARTVAIRLGIAVTVIFLGIVLVVWYQLRASFSDLPGTVRIGAIESPVLVELDKLGIPTISASSRLDALSVLGFVTARDRLFQMDLMRRKSAGKLAEILGEPAVGIDIRQRHLGFHRAAKEIVANLPKHHKQALLAYAEGFNAFLSQANNLPLEFIALGYQPEPWRIEDSILVALTMFQQLTWNEHDERMLTVMVETLPKDVVAFFTPDRDEYDVVLLGGPKSRRPLQSIPIKALASLPLTEAIIAESKALNTGAALIGSNNWAVNGSKTFDGRAILANDMHLGLSVPNIWYRTVISYGEVELSGLILPGLPILIAGTNSKVAWGHTNILADVIDLVRLEINPLNSSEYLTPYGWKAFATTTEVIQIKESEDREIVVKDTIWGPVSTTALLGRSVAIRWTALQPDAVNMEMLELDKVERLEQAIAVLNRSGTPPTNVILADSQGRIAWTYAGKFPRRYGFDGTVSQSWSANTIGWDGYIEADELPTVIDPPSGYLVTANNRTLGSEYRYGIGHNYAHSYRAFHIGQRLSKMQNIQEQDLLQLQLDTTTEFYEFYRNLALSVLTQEATRNEPELRLLRRLITKWDGKADRDSQGLPVLVEFRKRLAQHVIIPYLTVCRDREASFYYQWYKMETPLRRLLTEKIPSILPSRRFKDWNELILKTLQQTAADLKIRFDVSSLAELRWGRVNRIKISHPLSRAVPWLSQFLDMETMDLGGCSYCVKVIRQSYGATERMVISPGKSQDGILHMPAGQSGHPLSPHYGDQHRYWVQGRPLRFNPGQAKNTIRFVPLGSS